MPPASASRTTTKSAAGAPATRRFSQVNVFSRDALAGKDVAKAQSALVETIAVLDRAANKRTIHPNTAARRKSRLAKRLNVLKTPKK